MRINKFIARATGIGRRAADADIAAGKVQVNGLPPSPGMDVTENDIITWGGRRLQVTPEEYTTIMLNKPVGYVVSRDGQGSRTIYDLLPPEYLRLKPIGRLDKDSSGLLLLTSNGQLAHELTHPSRQKNKVYEITINAPLQPLHRQMVADHGLILDDGLSRLQLERLHEGNERAWRVTMHEGRNRQIRRTFKALGYTVTSLHRISFGPFGLGQLAAGQYQLVQPGEDSHDEAQGE